MRLFTLLLATSILLAQPLSLCSARLPQQHILQQQQLRTNPDGEDNWNVRPIVGILTQAGLDEDKFVPENGTYIASSYVKFVESGGARVVPILADTPADVLHGLLKNLNGFLIPGGAANLRPGHMFYDTAKRVLNFALAENDAGRYFPVLGICLGFETLMILTAGTHDILHPYDSDGMAAQLFFTADAPTSRFFRSWDLDLVFDVLQTPLTRESHSSGVSLKDFYQNKRLNEFFAPLSLSLDKEGKVYISTVEAKKYPVLGLQWHPEKNSFEWTRHKNIPHGYWSSEVTHQTIRFYINETRRSLSHFQDVVDEDIWLIYNDKVVFSGRHIHKDDPVWAEQAHVFPDWHTYSADLSQRAALAGRHWLDSIGLSCDTAEVGSSRRSSSGSTGHKETEAHSAGALKQGPHINAAGAAGGIVTGPAGHGILVHAAQWLKALATHMGVE